MIAIIPARLGSKRLPKKNILPLCGKPLVAYSIEAALNSNAVDGVYVSTDDEEVVSIAQSYGAEVPFLRPDYLGRDTASTEDVCEHMLEFLERKSSLDTSSFVLLQPTSPLRTAQHIDGAVSVFKKKNADSVVSVSEFEHPVSWALSVENEILTPCFSEELKKRSQDCALRYHPNGAVFVFDTAFFRKRVGRYGKRTFPYVMNRNSSVDIDTKFDFEYAEFLVRRQRSLGESGGRS